MENRYALREQSEAYAKAREELLDAEISLRDQLNARGQFGANGCERSSSSRRLAGRPGGCKTSCFGKMRRDFCIGSEKTDYDQPWFTPTLPTPPTIIRDITTCMRHCCCTTILNRRALVDTALTGSCRHIRSRPRWRLRWIV